VEATLFGSLALIKKRKESCNACLHLHDVLPGFEEINIKAIALYCSIISFLTEFSCLLIPF